MGREIHAIVEQKESPPQDASVGNHTHKSRTQKDAAPTAANLNKQEQGKPTARHTDLLARELARLMEELEALGARDRTTETITETKTHISDAEQERNEPIRHQPDSLDRRLGGIMGEIGETNCTIKHAGTNGRGNHGR